VDIVELFVKALETGGKVLVAEVNAGVFSLLAKEFLPEGLLSECSARPTASTPN
jgi:hypothetical protein